MGLHSTDEFEPRLPPPAFRTNGEMRARVIDPAHLAWVRGRLGASEVPVVAGARLLLAAADIVERGNSFDLGVIDITVPGVGDALGKLTVDAHTAVADGVLGMPYETFAAFFTMNGSGESPGPMLMAAVADQEGRPERFAFFMSLAVQGFGAMLFPRVLERVVRTGAGLSSRSLFGNYPNQVSPIGNEARLLLCGALAMVADGRIGMQRIEAAEQLNRARQRRGKAPIPPFWKVASGAMSELYTTPVGSKQSHGAALGGHHRSPDGA